jgi:ComF family protein
VKYSKQRYWIKTLCESFIQEYFQVSQNYLVTKPDLLIPIPIYKSKRKVRGYNQAELIAHTLAINTGITLLKDALIKTKATETQAQLSKQERLKNLRGSISISKKVFKQKSLIGRHIALIDDVMTTKATCELASRLLLENGAKRVDVWCLARTPKYTSTN